jgi:hypothetical protein
MANRKSYLNQLPLAIRVPLWKLFKSGATLINDIEGDIVGNADTATLAATVTVVDSTDATSFIALFDSATGDMAVKTDGGLLYNSTTGMITASFTGSVAGALTGNVLAVDTAVIVNSGADIANSVVTAGSVVASTLSVPGGTLSVGVVDSIGGDIVLHAKNEEGGGSIKMFTDPGSDGTIDYFRIRVGEASLDIGPDVDLTSFIYDGAESPKWRFRDADGLKIFNILELGDVVAQTHTFDLGSIDQYGFEQDLNTTGTLTANTSVVGFYQDVTGNIVNSGHLMNQSGGVFRSIITAGTYAYNNVVFAFTNQAAGTVTDNYCFEGQLFVDGGTTTTAYGVNFYIANFGGTLGTAYGTKVTFEGDIDTAAYGFHVDGSAATGAGATFGVFTTGVETDVLGAEVVKIPQGLVDIGIQESAGRYGQLNLWGAAPTSQQGGKVVFYASADVGYSANTFEIEVEGAVMSLHAGSDHSFVNDGSNNWSFITPGGTVTFGLDNAAGGIGQVVFAADDDDTGGIITFQVPTSYRAGFGVDEYKMQIDEDNFMFGPTGNTTMLKYNPSKTQLEVNSTNFMVDWRLFEGPSSVDGKYQGDIIERIIDTAAAIAGEGLFLAADGNYEHSDADAAASMPCVAIAGEDYEASTEKVLLIRGMFTHDVWDWSAPGVTIYVDVAAGGFTETAPSGSGDQVQVVGYALTDDTIWFDPDLTLIEIA